MDFLVDVVLGLMGIDWKKCFCEYLWTTDDDLFNNSDESEPTAIHILFCTDEVYASLYFEMQSHNIETGKSCLSNKIK